MTLDEPTEKAIDARIVKWLDRIGAWHFKTHGSEMGRAGIPDRIVCFRGKFYAFEVKRPSTKTRVSRLQEIELERIVKAGGVSAVVWSLEQVQEIIGKEYA